MPTVIPGIYPRTGVVGPNGNTVIGPRPSVLHSVARWLDANGTVLGDSQVTVDAAGNISTPGTVNGRDVSIDGQNLDAALASLLRLPSTDQKAALVGTNGSPSAANPYVTDSDPRLGGGGGGGPPTGAAGGQLGGTYPDPDVRGIRETGGPTELTISSIADLAFLQRSGTSIIGVPAPFANVGVVSTATSHTITTAETYIAVTSTAASRVMTLPSASAVPEGWEITIYDASGACGNPNTISVTPAGADTLDGVNASRVMSIPRDTVIVVQRGGAWTFKRAPAVVLNVAAFGKLNADGVTDDYAVIQAALDAGPAAASDASGFRVFLPRGRYRTSQTLVVRRCIVFEGEGSGSFNGYGTAIVPDKFAEGIKISGITDSGVASMRADLAIVRNLVIDFPVSAQSTVWASTHAYSLGDLVVPSTGSPAHHFVFRCTTAGTSGGSQPAFVGVDLAGTISDGSVTWTAISVNGINVRVKSMVENVSILNSPGNGLYMYGSTGATPATNCNAFVLRRINVLTAKLNGFFIDGADANAGYAEKLFCSLARYWGVYDSSFLGNTHVAHDVDSCGLGPYHDDDANQKNVWIGCYSEGGQPESRIEGNSVVLGGLHSAGFDGIYTGRNIGAAVNGDTPFAVIGQQNGVTVRLNGTSTDKYAFGVQHSSESGDLRLQLGSAPTGAGWWNWSYAGLDSYLSYAIAGDQAGNDAATGYEDKAAFWIRPSLQESFFYLGYQKQKIGNIGASGTVPTNAFYKKGDFAFDFNWDYQGHVGGSRDGTHGWQFDKTGSAPWRARWPFFGHGNQQAKVNGVGSPYAIDMKADAGTTFTNLGASAKVYFTLPTTSGGGLVDEVAYVEYTFLVVDADGIRVVSQDAAIRMGSLVTSGAGYLESTEIGATITIKCSSSTMWYVTKLTGTWTDGTSIFAAGGGAGSLRVVTDRTTGITLTDSDSNKSFTNQGASGAVTLTSPASPGTGFYVRLRVSAAQTLTFQLPTGHTLYVDDITSSTSGGSLAANTVGCSAELEYVGNSKWFAKISGTWVAS